MQTINRNNYEEFFLLYVDNELNEASKTAVENFVQQNPDLTTEFAMLMQTKYAAEETMIFDKEILLRTEGNSINEINYEEYFLLYIDNELSTAKREEVEMYVLQHPKLQDEFTTLKQAVIATEIINYDDKKDLYRTEKRRTFYLKPLQLAVAAIFIGICAVGFWLMQKPATDIKVADNHQIQQPAMPNIAAPKAVDSSNKTKQQPEQIVVAHQPSTLIKKEKNNIATATIVKKKKAKATDNFADDNNNTLPQVAVEQQLIKHNDIEKNQKEPPAEINDIALAPQHIQQPQNDVAALQTTTGKNNNSYVVYPVAYKELNTNDDDNSLHVGMLDLNKTKVKNLFKKAGRFFGNKTNDLANEDGKLQVANFEIETKKQ